MWRSIKRCRSAKTYFLNNGFGSRLGVRSRLKALRQAKLLFEILATHTYSAFERQHFKRRIWLVGGDNCTVMRNIEIQIKSNNESLNFANFGLFSSIDPKPSENIPQMMPMQSSTYQHTNLSKNFSIYQDFSEFGITVY